MFTFHIQLNLCSISRFLKPAQYIFSQIIDIYFLSLIRLTIFIQLRNFYNIIH